MSVTQAAHERLVPLGRIRVPDNVRELDGSHVEALAGSIALQGMLVPLVVRAEGERFELVAGFHRIAAAHKLGLTEVPVVVRDAASEDADRAVENIASCRLRHDVINADRVVMPMSELKCPTVRCEPGGEVGISTRTDPGSQAAAADLAEVRAIARLRRRARHRHPATRSRSSRASTSPVSVNGTASARSGHSWRRAQKAPLAVGFGDSRCRRTASWPKGVPSSDGGFRGAGGGGPREHSPRKDPRLWPPRYALASPASSLPRTGGVGSYSASAPIVCGTCRSP
jgi:hypothetical protein